MYNLIYFLIYITAIAVTYGLMTIAGWWLRYIFVVVYLTLPAMMVVVVCWSFLTLPVVIFFNGSALHGHVTVWSHWLNDRLWDFLCFCFMLPFEIIMFPFNIIHKMMYGF